jgi:hypothetical protein
MVINTTHTDKNNNELENGIVGKSFSFIKSIKLGGIGSKRMIIEEASANFKDQLNLVSDINYANIELRPHGLLIRIIKGHKSFTWAVPYYQLHVYNTDGFSIHAQGRFIRLKKNKLFKENKNFLEKMFFLKEKYLEKYEFRYD